MLDYTTVMAWPFEPVAKHYAGEDVVRAAKGMGAGLPGPLEEGDAVFMDKVTPKPLPMMATVLADGEFWQSDPATGIDWQKIVHAGESITQHRPLPPEGKVTVTQGIEGIYDRGPDKSAVMYQWQNVSSPDGEPYVTIQVTTVLRGDGGFGGEPDPRPRLKTVPDSQEPDDRLVMRAPVAEAAEAAGLVIAVPLSVASGAEQSQPMLRGMGIFGLAGRAAIASLCDNDPDRLKHFAVRYAGPLFCGEEVAIEIWRLAPGRAALRMTAVARNKPVLSHCLVEYR